MPRSAASGSHGLSSSSSARQKVNLPGWPRVERSSWPGIPPSTLMMSSRSARPIVALARLPLPSTLWVAFMPSARRTGPFTTTNGALPPVLAVLPCRPNSGSHIALTIAITTGRYSGRQPAITAAMATFSAVIRRRRTGSMPTTSSGARPAAFKKPTHRVLGGRHDRQPVGPAVALEQLVRLEGVGDLVLRASQRLHHHASLAPAITPAYLRSLGAPTANRCREYHPLADASRGDDSGARRSADETETTPCSIS